MSALTKNRLKGLLMVILGAALWGISGTVAQHLFQREGVSVSWLVTIRLLVSGCLLLVFSFFGPKPQKTWEILRRPRRVLQLVVFGIVGMLGVQYTYFASVHLGNAAIATLLQYLAPLFILIYDMGRTRKLPKLVEMVAIILALMGTYLLLTNGAGTHMPFSRSACIWGVLSGVALAFYTIYPGNLLKEWGSPVVIGWSMLIGGIVLSFFNPPWQTSHIVMGFQTVSFIIFVVLFGTLLAFYLYLESLNYLTPKESSLLACVEPLTAVVTAVIWLGVTMGGFQSLGAGCVILMIILLAVKPKNNQPQITEQSTQTKSL